MATSLYHNLGGVQIPRSLIWVDEFARSNVARSMEPSITGALIVDMSVRAQVGRPITLQGVDDHGWVRRDGLLSLYALSNQALEEMTLTLADGRSFIVNFADGSPIDAKEIARAEIAPSNLPYVVTVRLIVVRQA